MRNLILTGFLLTISLALHAQMFSATFEYDANGNRTQATVIYLSKSAQIGNHELFQEEITDELTVKVYPNPTQGLLRVEIYEVAEEFFDSKQNVITVNDVNGRLLIQITPVLPVNEVNLSNNPNGVYFMRLKIGKFSKTYKIIKQ